MIRLVRNDRAGDDLDTGDWDAEGGPMLTALNHLVEAVEEVRVAAVAATHGTTEHHLRRMFSSLAGMPLSEYVRRRRMTLAAADVVTSRDDLLTVAVRHGYGSSEAFGRAFRAVHVVGPMKWTRVLGQGFRWGVASIMAVEPEGATRDGTTS